MKLFYREMGQGPALLILHGLFGSSDNWLSVAKVLSQNFRVILPDARNHGQSPFADQHNYDVMSQDLHELLQDLELDQPYLIGHSMGGKTVMKFLSLYPGLVKKAVVADIAPRHYNRHHDHILDGLTAIPVASLQSRQEADQVLAAYIQDLGERQFLLKNLYRNDDGKFQWRINLDILTRQIENIGEGLDEHIRIETPVLFLHGGNSKYVTEKDLPLISSIFNHYTLETIEGAGHWLHAEKPQEFITDVLRFLKD